MSTPNQNENHSADPASPPVSCSATTARDQQWMQEMCELVKNKIPESHTFVVFAFPVSTSDRCYYASNATRQSAVEALREWLDFQQSVDNWMKHDEGPPPPAPWPKSSEAQRAPIELNAAQESLAKQWAADDRLWTTQETVEFNLRIFARAILSAESPNEKVSDER